MSQNIPNLKPNQLVYTNNQYTQQPNFTAGNGTVSSGNAIVNNNPILSRAEKGASDNPLILPLGTLGFGTALIGLTNFMNKPLQTKNYKDTFYHTVEDKVKDFAQKPKVSSVLDYLSKKKQWLSNKLNKSEIYRTLRYKQSIGGSQVQSQAAGSKGHVATRAMEIMKKYKEANPNYTGFDSIISKYGKEASLFKDEILKEFGQAVKKLPKDELTKTFSKRPWWGLGLVKNESSLLEIVNKSKLIDYYKSTNSKVGQKAAGYLLRSAECLTNGMFSGKGAVLIQAFFIAQSLQEAMKAEKGEKFSTFMASFAELMAMMATIGIQMRIMNSLAGLKNIGMSEANVKTVQQLKQTANEAAKAGKKATYDQTLAQIKKLQNVSKKGAAAAGNTALKWYQKPVKWLGNLISYGRIRETIKPLKNNKFATSLAKIPYGLKVGAGYAGRIALLMAVVLPIFSGTAKKLSYAIFGKPVKTLEKEKNEGKEPQQVQEQPQQPNTNPTQSIVKPQEPKPQLNTEQPQNVQTYQSGKPGNLVDKMQQQYQQKQNPIGAQSMQQSPVASSELKTPEYQAGITRTYIPNPILGYEAPVNPASSRSAQIDAVLRQADIVEAQAQRFM